MKTNTFLIFLFVLGTSSIFSQESKQESKFALGVDLLYLGINTQYEITAKSALRADLTFRIITLKVNYFFNKRINPFGIFKRGSFIRYHGPGILFFLDESGYGITYPIGLKYHFETFPIELYKDAGILFFDEYVLPICSFGLRYHL